MVELQLPISSCKNFKIVVNFSYIITNAFLLLSIKISLEILQNFTFFPVSFVFLVKVVSVVSFFYSLNSHFPFYVHF